MSRSSYIWIGVAICFMLVLLYATFRSTLTPAGRTADELSAATLECERAIRADIPDGRFPFDPTATNLSDDRLHLSGTLDTGSGAQTTRRNYECFLSTSSSTGEYVADSVEVWQSH